MQTSGGQRVRHIVQERVRARGGGGGGGRGVRVYQEVDILAEPCSRIDPATTHTHQKKWALS
jgi:hypothetical protein